MSPTDRSHGRRAAAVRLLLAGVLLHAVACASIPLTPIAMPPIGPLPGGTLRGQVTPVPEDWASLADYRTIQLETRPDEPYSVNVWGIAAEEAFFIACRPDSRWLPYVLENPNVRLRILDRLYELRAERSVDAGERARYFAAMKRKYDWEPDDDDRATAWILRLTPRPPRGER